MFDLKKSSMPKIDVAKTVKSIVAGKNEYAQSLIDRTFVLNKEQISSILNQSTLTYVGRTPAPALDSQGNFQCTDLDLLSFLSPIAARGAVIEIPKYSNRRKVVKRAGERKIGSTNFGPITSLVSNKDVFSFSVRIHDKTIITKDSHTEKEKVGAFRNYMIVDCDGFWYDGWNRICWDPNAEENAFLKENRLLSGNTVFFQNYVHPNRWQSVFGAPYLLKKMLLARIDDEASFYRNEVKRLIDSGISLPEGEKKEYQAILSEGKTETIEVKTLEMLLSIPDFKGSYTPVANTADGLVAAYRRQKLLTYTWKTQVQFSTRADEAAFMLYGLDANDNGRIAHWIKNAAWTQWSKSSRSAKYNQLVLSDDMALLYRTKLKTERVASE